MGETAPDMYSSMSREQLAEILMGAGGKPDKVPDPEAFRQAWQAAPVVPDQNAKGNAWSLVPLEDLDQYSTKQAYDLMNHLVDDFGIKPPKSWDLLSIEQLKEFLREQVTSEDVRDRHEAFEKRRTEEHKTAIRNINVTDVRTREQTSRALDAILEDNDPPKIFVRGGGLVRLITDEKGTPSIENCNKDILKSILERCADFTRLRGDRSEKAISPPNELVLDILAIRPWSQFPALEGIIECPVILPNGTVTGTPGYYPDLRMIYLPSPELNLPKIPDHPSHTDITRAVSLLHEIFEDFPFLEEDSRTNTIAALITAVLRPVIVGYVPLALIDKPQPGIGASLMTDIIAMVATGRPGAKMTAPTNEEEWRKTITARLSQGQGLIIIDNVDKPLFSGSLASVITSDTWNDRVLGQSATITLSNHAVIIANGINVQTGPDIARRVYWIRIDAHQARPDQRTDFHHPDILQWVKDRRGDILAAVLTLTRAWILAGNPQPDEVPRMGSFEKWRGMVGGILVNAGVKSFLGNLEQFRERSDILTSQWDSFLDVLREHFSGPFTVKQVTGLLEGEQDDRQSKFNDQGTRLCDVIPDDIPLKDKDPGRAIGKAFSKRADHVFPSGIVLRKSGDRDHNLIMWIVEKVDPQKHVHSTS